MSSTTSTQTVTPSNFYTGGSGEQYFRSTGRSKSEVAQAESAGVFHPYLSGDEVVLDFGCGTGAIVSNVPAKRRLGVEINEPSVAAARARGVEVYTAVTDVPDAVADAVITHHALEHTLEPLAVLRELRRVLRPGGRIVVVVPAEEPHRKGNHRFTADDPSQHLFCWTPRTLSNLMQVAGFQVESAHLSSWTGYSHYFEWARPIPGLLRLSRWAVGRLASRMSTVWVARRPAGDAGVDGGGAK
jgi:SAM-dependent methyltransferase